MMDFQLDVGSVVACKLLNPENRLPVVICSSNVYANRAETDGSAKSCLDAINQLGRKAVAVSIMSLSNRMLLLTLYTTS